MNKRKFLKGLMLLLAIPVNLYAKLTRQTALREIKVEGFDQLCVGMRFTMPWTDGNVLTILELNPKTHRGEPLCSSYRKAIVSALKPVVLNEDGLLWGVHPELFCFSIWDEMKHSKFYAAA